MVRAEPDGERTASPERMWLEARTARGPSTGLDAMVALLDALGRPQTGLQVIQVAGTNGKGSVATYAAALLTAQGLRTGLYLSPHLWRLNERFVIDGTEVDDGALDSSLREVIAEAERLDVRGIHASYFDVTTAVALDLCCRAKVRWVVLEVGLGGRLDSTSAVAPSVAVVTSIDLDHTTILGSTLPAITGEKGAIFGAAAHAICGEMRPTLVAQLRRCAKAVPFVEVPRSALTAVHIDAVHWRARCVLGDGSRRALQIPRPSRIGLRCGAIALAAVDAALGAAINPSPLRDVSIPGRLERINESPLTVLDGAHNPAAVGALATTLQPLVEDCPVHVLFGAMADKDVGGMIGALGPLACQWHLAAPKVQRAATTAQIATAITTRTPAARVRSYESVADALEGARSHASAESGAVLVCGSFYVVGEALHAVGRPSAIAFKRPSAT